MAQFSWQKIRRAIVALLAFGSLMLDVPAARADSPLTSTNFADAYADVELVRLAEREGLTEEVLQALSAPDVPYDVRAAIINALGWSTEGQNNAREYLEYIACSREERVSELTLEELTPQETFSLGYLLAMDDYFELSPLGGNRPLEQLDAVTVLRESALKEPTNFSVALINSLAQAQLLLENPNSWCDIYQLVAAVNQNFGGDRDLRPKAVEIVMNYIELYQDSCPAS